MHRKIEPINLEKKVFLKKEQHYETLHRRGNNNLSKVLKVMNEIGQFATLIHLFARAHNRFRERPRPAAEHANLAHVTVLLLYKLQERRHVRSTKVVHCLQTSEHTPLRDALKVVLANVQHGRPQVELVEELRNKDVHFEHVRDIFTFDISEHVDEPLEMAVARTRPQEIHLFTGDT